MDADEIFIKMKDTILSVIQNYGTRKINYVLIPFGQQPISNIESTGGFKNILNRLQRPTGDVNLTKAMDAFKSVIRQSNSMKVLVVMMDKKSSNEQIKVVEAAKILNDLKVKVVPVGIGRNADPKELESIATNKGYLVKTAKDVAPQRLAEIIMDKVLKGKLVQLRSPFCKAYLCTKHTMKIKWVK